MLVIVVALASGVGLSFMGVALAVSLGPWPLAAGVVVTSAALGFALVVVQRRRRTTSRAVTRPAGPSSVRPLLGGSSWRSPRAEASCRGAAHRES